MELRTVYLDTSLSAVSMSWNYIAESIFNMLVLLSLVKGADRIAKEMFGVYVARHDF